jgi:antitoxin ParD1/3/4
MPTRVALGNQFETFTRNQRELEALRAEIAAGSASGPSRPAEEVFDRLEAKYAARLKSEAN